MDKNTRHGITVPKLVLNYDSKVIGIACQTPGGHAGIPYF